MDSAADDPVRGDQPLPDGTIFRRVRSRGRHRAARPGPPIFSPDRDGPFEVQPDRAEKVEPEPGLARFLNILFFAIIFFVISNTYLSTQITLSEKAKTIFLTIQICKIIILSPAF